jgi:hypothetical protein
LREAANAGSVVEQMADRNGLPGLDVLNQFIGRMVQKRINNGILFSISGFSNGVIKNVKDLVGNRSTILLFGEHDLRNLVENPSNFEVLLNKKYQELVLRGEVLVE